ncbi:HTH-type transcriptional regulator/antitoxin HigA [Methylobacterium sp. B4]|nr:HTH-type transcriptional regulator/antitoxin HigA [Methylobacterium sp. B4]
MEGLPQGVLQGVRRSLTTELSELQLSLKSYIQARTGDFTLLRKQAGNDLGTYLIAARIIKGLSQKELARKLGLREQAIQRWESERYRSISLFNYQKVARTLGVHWQVNDSAAADAVWHPAYDINRSDLSKVVRHARRHAWIDISDTSDENAISTLVRYVGDHVNRYGTPSLLRTGLNVGDCSQDWSLLSWKAQVTRRAEALIASSKPRYYPLNVSWLMELVRLSVLADGPLRARQLLHDNGIVLIAEPQIPGMNVDGAAFLVDSTPVIGLTLLRDSIDNFWFTLLHEVGHVILHYRTGLSSGFFDNFESQEVDEFENEANQFAGNLLIPDEIWSRTPARIAKNAEPVEKLATQLRINPAIIFGRIRMEREDYSIFSNKIGRGTVRKLLLDDSSEVI